MICAALATACGRFGYQGTGVDDGGQGSTDGAITDGDVNDGDITVGPAALDLDFSGCQFPPELEFSRASQASYYDSAGVLRVAASNEPRCDYDPISGAVLGLLVEGTRTNMVLYSTRLENPTWNGEAIPTANAASGPDMALTADQLTDESEISGDLRFQSVSIANNEDNYVCSAFLKGNTSTVAELSCDLLGGEIEVLSTIRIDLASGTAQDVGAAKATSFGLESSSHGFVRAWLHVANNGSGNVEITTSLAPTAASQDVAATGSILAWGVQVESSSAADYGVLDHPSSFILTEASTATRLADEVYTEDISWFNDSEGSIVARFQSRGFATNNGGGILINYGDVCCGGGFHKVALRMLWNGGWHFAGELAPGDEATTTLLDSDDITPAGLSTALGLTYSPDASALARDGQVVVTGPGTGVDTIPNIANLSIGSIQLGQAQPRATLRLLRLRTFASALSEDDLAAATAQ